MRIEASLAAIAGALAFGSCTLAPAATTGPGKQALIDGEWKYWGGDPQTDALCSARPDQRRRMSNRLKIAWRWSADTSGVACVLQLQVDAAAGRRRPLHALAQPWRRRDRRRHRQDDVDLRAAACATSAAAPPSSRRARSPTGPTATTKRLFHNSIDGRLIAIDAKTGKAGRRIRRQGLRSTCAPA